jgi:hypothetical protein
MHMNISSIKRDDIVECDVRGRRFHAQVTEDPQNGELSVLPLDKRINYFSVRSNQVVKHYRLMGRPRSKVSMQTAA